MKIVDFITVISFIIIGANARLNAASDVDVDITIRINPDRKLVEFTIQNYEEMDIKCSRVSITADYIDKHGNKIGPREITIRNQHVGANSLLNVPERGKEIIEILEGQYDNPTIGGYGNINSKCFKNPNFIQLCEDRSNTAEQKRTFDVLKSKVSATNCFSAYQKLRRLTKLSITDSTVIDISPLGFLHNLEWIQLSGTQVRNTWPLVALSNINRLDLQSTPVSDIRPLTRLNNLKTLNLALTKVRDTRLMANLNNLENLDLEFTYVTEIGPLSSLSKLKTLNLANTQVTNIGPLASLYKLEKLDLENTEVSYDQIRWLKEKLPNCSIRNPVPPLPTPGSPIPW